MLLARTARVDTSNKQNANASNSADLPDAFGANKPMIPFSLVKSTTLSSP